MNAYRFDELAVGLGHAFTVTVTAAMVDRFRADTGDDNPLHADPTFAAEFGHPGVVVFGLLTASFYSTLVGVHLPGRHALLHGVDVGFLRPVYVGDTLTVAGAIAYRNEAYRQLELAATIHNQAGVKVSKAKLKVGVLA
jgi:3-hydroxybutyryl-CoA dehydratase